MLLIQKLSFLFQPTHNHKKSGAPDDGRRDVRRLHHSLAALRHDVVLPQVLDDAGAGVVGPQKRST